MKTYSNIDYAFAPASYWTDTDPLAAILRNVKGENRRQMIRDYWAVGKLDELDPSLLADELDDNARRGLGRIAPSFMGGEYLPSYGLGEVEIVRICLQSTTGDVISLRAAPSKTGIRYRVVDEYDVVFVLPIQTSPTPLTLEQLIRLLDKGDTKGRDLAGGLSLGYNEINAEFSDREDLRHFTRISSDFYPSSSNTTSDCSMNGC